MTRSRELAEFATAYDTGGYPHFRNRIINGDMQIWQRGTSSSSSGYQTVDRWAQQVAGTTTFSRETSVVPDGSKYALKWTTGASSSYGQIRQWIETANLYDLRGKTVTASAMVRCNSVFTGNLQFEVGYATTGDSSSASYTVIPGPITGTVTDSGYTKITWTGIIPANALGLYIGIVPTVVQASGATAYMGQVQLEKGSTATSFDYRPYGTELQLCKRYFDYLVNNGSTTIGLGRGDAYYYIVMNLPLLRANPTLALNGTLNVTNYSSNATTLTSVLGQSFTIGNNLQVTFNTAGTYSLGAYIVATSGYISLSAEL